MNTKEIFFRYVGPILTIPAMIGAVIGADQLLVWNGTRHAQSLCADPGPVIIHDRRLWNTYSKTLRSRLLPEDYANPGPIGKQTRKELGIQIDLVRIAPKNPLLVTAKYIRVELQNENKKIAELNYYGSDEHSPILNLFFPVEIQREYICRNAINSRHAIFPEFY